MNGSILNAEGRQVGYVSKGFAFDIDGVKRYLLDGINLKDLQTGEIVGHLTAAGDPAVSISSNSDKLFASLRRD
jgi:hypothetical protein